MEGMLGFARRPSHCERDSLRTPGDLKHSRSFAYPLKGVLVDTSRVGVFFRAEIEQLFYNAFIIEMLGRNAASVTMPTMMPTTTMIRGSRSDDTLLSE